jgi:hypothetical protein
LFEGGLFLVRTFFFIFVFAFVYMLISLNIGEQAGQETVAQLNYGLIIGALMWIAWKVSEMKGK